MNNRNSGAEFFAGLIIGSLVGAALAILLAPQSGEETRAQIRDRGLEFKDRAEEGVLEARQRMQHQVAGLQDQVAGLQQQISALQDRGRQTATDAIERGRQALNRS